jgi:hypothetical protein
MQSRDLSVFVTRPPIPQFTSASDMEPLSARGMLPDAIQATEFRETTRCIRFVISPASTSFGQGIMYPRGLFYLPMYSHGFPVMHGFNGN